MESFRFHSSPYAIHAIDLCTLIIHISFRIHFNLTFIAAFHSSFDLAMFMSPLLSTDADTTAAHMQCTMYILRSFHLIQMLFNVCLYRIYSNNKQCSLPAFSPHHLHQLHCLSYLNLMVGNNLTKYLHIHS